MAAQTYQSEYTGSQMDAKFTAVAELQSAITELQTAVAAKYSKPSGGIPATDLDADVNAALAKANSAIQSLADYYTKAEVDALIATINGQQYVDASSLPTASASTMGKIYLIGPDASGYYSYYYTSYDGTNYSWVGPLGTTQISLANYATKAELNQLDQEVNGFSWTEGKYLKSSGAEEADTDWCYTDYIPYTQGNDVVWKWGNAGAVQSGRCILFYKSDKSYISNGYWSASGSSGQKTLSAAGIASDAPAGAFIRASFKPGQGASVTIGGVVAWKEDTGLVGKIDNLKDGVSALQNELNIADTNVPQSPTSSLVGSYIGSDGSLSSYSGYSSDVYDVSRITKVHLTIVKGQNLASRQFAFYSVTEGFAAGNCLQVGPTVNSEMSSGTTDLDVPAGAKVMLAVNYSDVVTQSMTADTSTPVKEIVQELDAAAQRPLAVKYDGTNLYIAYIDGSVEYCYWFKKCLANELFSFYLVGYRATTRTIPNADGITEDSVTQLNRAASDNIGPVSMSVGGYVGGNHLYEDTTVKTAKTDSVAVAVDGKAIASGFSGYGGKVAVKVVNTVYDPSVAPASGAEILSTSLYTETVDYLVEKNNIGVSVCLQFVANAPNRLSNYYGMQSAFVGETGVMTPNGKLANGFSLPDSDNFTKGAYPSFNRFVEKKDAGYQSTYLIPNKAGAHGMIEDSDEIFNRSNTKDYHRVAIGGTVAGRRITWSGVYTFCASALEDDASVLAYMGVVNGKDTIFIASKAACDVNISIPTDFLFKPCEIVEKVGDIDTDNTFVDVDGIHITATGTGSLIISLNP